MQTSQAARWLDSLAIFDNMAAATPPGDRRWTIGMEENVKKRIFVGVIAGCLVVAGLVTWLTRPPKRGIPGRFAKELIWVKCRDPNCQAEYQVTKKNYYEYIEKNTQLWALEAPGLVCKKCGRKTVYEAVKCEKCGLVFKVYSVPRDFRDRCPQCGYSKMQDERDRANPAKAKKTGSQLPAAAEGK